MKVLLDAHQVPFSGYYKTLLTNVGVEVEDFWIPLVERRPFLAYCDLVARSDARILHFLWAHDHPATLLLPRIIGKKVILHWIGSDVSVALNESYIPWKRLASCHLSMDVSLSRELRSLGIKAPVVRGVVPFPDKIPPWPMDYKVLTYLPKTSGDLYSPDETLQLARDLPWATFLVTGNDGKDMPALNNVRYLGWVDNMEDVYAQVKVVVRLTKHDSGGGSAMEGLVRERYAIWTKRYDGCQFADSYERAKYELEWCLKRKQSNKIGREVVLKDFDQQKITQQLLAVYRSLS